MNKQIGKNMFDGMELPEQTKKEAIRYELTRKI